MIGSIASVPLPDSTGPLPDPGSLYDPLQRTLYNRYSIEVPVFTFPAHPRRLVRISAQVYNSRAQFEQLARALTETL
jgi:isopenicillin-N epimerase